MTERPLPPRLGFPFDDALVYAHDAHRHQRRKGSETPYFAHLMSVAALVIEDGGSENEAIAALLHDAVEDQGGAERLADIQWRFGEAVAGIVEDCSDTDEVPKPPWRPRKERYLDALAHKRAPSRRVSLADKLDNARAIVRDYRDCGERLWDRFNAGRDDVLWYYEELARAFEPDGDGPMAAELRRVVAELNQLVQHAAQRAEDHM